MLPDYRRLCRSPITVSRWWDPRDDEGWQLGERCLLKIEGYNTRSVPTGKLSSLGLVVRPVSEHWLEFSRLSP